MSAYPPEALLLRRRLARGQWLAPQPPEAHTARSRFAGWHWMPPHGAGCERERRSGPSSTFHWQRHLSKIEHLAGTISSSLVRDDGRRCKDHRLRELDCGIGAIALAHSSQDRDRRIATFVLQWKLDNFSHGPLPLFYRQTDCRTRAREFDKNTLPLFASQQKNNAAAYLTARKMCAELGQPGVRSLLQQS